MIYCEAHEHSLSAERCNAIHMHIQDYQVKSKSSSMTSLFQMLVRNSEHAYSVLIEVGSTAVADCMQRILPNTKSDASTIQGQGLGSSAPEPRSLLCWALNGSSFYSSDEICYKLQYERHHHHYIHITTITKHRELQEYSLRSSSKSKTYWSWAKSTLINCGAHFTDSPFVPSITPTQLSLRTTSCMYYCE